MQTENSLNYLSLPTRPAQPSTELAGAGETTGRTEGGQTLVRPTSAIAMPWSGGGGPESPVPSAAPQPACAVAVPRPPHVVRIAAGKLFPASGYEWVNPTAPQDLRVRLMPGLVNTEDGKLRPASGYEWVNPIAPKDFQVKLRPGLIKTEDGFRPNKGYRWVNPRDPNDLRVEPLP